MPTENRAFLIRGDDGQEYGPVDLGELRDWVQENRVGLGTDVRLDTPGEPWHSWHDYPELVALLAEAQGTTASALPPGLVIAPVRRRFVAWIIDLFFIWILFIPIMNVAQYFLPMDAIEQAALNPAALQALPPEAFHRVVAFQVACNGLLALYITGFLAAHGKTPGKSIMRLMVVDENGAKPTLSKALLRTIAFILCLNFLFPLLYIFVHPQRRALHDLVAGTYVVEAP